MGRLAPLISPATYQTMYASFMRTKRAQISAGSFRPVLELMIATSVISYTMHYVCVDRYFIMEKQALVREALKNHHH